MGSVFAGAGCLAAADAAAKNVPAAKPAAAGNPLVYAMRPMKAELSRESTFLSVMAGVVSARAAVEDAAAGAVVRRRAWEVAAGKAEDLMARAKEGLEPVADALDAEAARDLAEAEYLRAAFTERVARENLDFAVGATTNNE